MIVRGAGPAFHCLLLVLVWGCGQAAAQGAPGGLTLAAALREALRRNPNTLLQQQSIEASRGLVLQAKGAFDPVVNVSGTQGRDLRPLRVDETAALTAAGITSIHDQMVDLTSYSAGVDALLTNGATVGTTVTVSSVSDNLQRVQDIPRQTTGRLAFTLTLPLLRNSGRATVGAALAAANAKLAAARERLVFTNAQTVLATALAYWDLVASYRRLEILRASEARIAALVEETRKLIAADQVPAADINLVLANLGDKRIARTAGEQALASTRLALARQMGLPAADAARLAPPSDEFPAMDASALRVESFVAPLTARALAQRADIQAARLAERAAGYAVSAARQNLKPRLDLDLGVAYTGLAQGAGPGNLNNALSTAQTGPSATASISLAFPWDNSAARGNFATQAALFDSTSIRLRDLLASVASTIPVAASALRQAAQQLADGSETVRRYRTSLKDEQTKRRLGTATLIDVITVEDRLSNALLTEVSLRQGYATALAQLRFDAGTLVRRDGREFAVRIDELRNARFAPQRREKEKR